MGHHEPDDVLKVRTCSPPVDAQPVATAPPSPGQLASERVAVGPANGEKDPVTVAPLMVMLFRPAEPVTPNGPGGIHVVGEPAGVVQCNLNLEGGAMGAGSATPLKMVAQLLAVPGSLTSSLPTILPICGVPKPVRHGLVVLPNRAAILIFSMLAVPPLKRGGEKMILPAHTPFAALHVTLPGSTGFVRAAWATPDPTVTKRSDGRASEASMRTVFRAIFIPRSIEPPANSEGGLAAVFPKVTDLTTGALKLPDAATTTHLATFVPTRAHPGRESRSEVPSNGHERESTSGLTRSFAQTNEETSRYWIRVGRLKA